MRTEDVLKNANFRTNTKSGGDSCLFCEYRNLSRDKKRVSCRLHNVILGEGEDFGSGEYVCDYFQESEWFAMSVKLLSDSPQSNSVSATKTSYGHQGNGNTSNKEGCYIATAVYGGYDKPEVLVLRKYRDNVLKKSWIGRRFIGVYYTISPFLAQKLKKNSLINRRIKKILDRIVRKVSCDSNTSEM